jgi:hypothetical protein
MSDMPAPEPISDPPESGLTNELGILGKNLIGVLRAAWDRPERQKLQQEIEGGINELGNTLRKEAKNVTENPVSQRIKSEVDDLSSRVRSGQLEGKVRDELVNALHLLNTELEKVASILASSSQAAESTEASPVSEAVDSQGIDASEAAAQEAPSEQAATPEEPVTAGPTDQDQADESPAEPSTGEA